MGVRSLDDPQIIIHPDAGFRKFWILPENTGQGNLNTCLNLLFLQPILAKPAIFIMISGRDRVNGIWNRFRLPTQSTEDTASEKPTRCQVFPIV